MHEIESMQALYDALTRDIKDTSSIVGRRYGVRFILLNAPVELSSCIQTVKHYGGLEYSISEASVLSPPNEDCLLTIWQALNFIQEKQGICIISGISQFSRDLSDEEFNKFFRDLADYETNSPERKIYIPLVDIHDRFRRIFWNDYPRNSQERVLPLKVAKQEATNRSVCLFSALSFDEKEGIHPVYNFKEWLDLEQQVHATKIVIKSNCLLRRFSKIQHGGGYYRYFEADSYAKFTASLYPSFFSHTWINESHHSSFWKKLLLVCDFTTNCCAFVERYFNYYNLSESIWLDLFFRKNDNFEKWLLLQFAASCSKEESYLQIVTKQILKEKSVSFSPVAFASLLYSHIFGLDADNRNLFAESRKHTLIEWRKIGASFDNIEVTVENKQWLTTLFKEDFYGFKQLYTGIFQFEKEIILNAYKEGSISLETVQELIPDIHLYLDDSCLEQYNVALWIKNYFSSYRSAKLKNVITEEIQRLLETINSSDAAFWKWFYDLSLTQDQIEALDNAYFVWVDALGFEWVPYIVNRLNSLLPEKEVLVQSSRCDLPSNTKLNRFDAVPKKSELDKLYHEGHYRYPESIFAEIDCVDKIVQDISALSEQHERVYVVSDHGASALSRLTDGLNQFSGVEHDGRYVTITRELVDDPYGITYTNSNDGKMYLIARTYHSLSSKPSREVHGGATPEEVIVPLLVIQPKPIKTTEPFYIEILDKNINTLSRSLRFFYKADTPARVEISIGGKKQYLDCRPDTERAINLPIMTAGEHKIIFSVGEKIITKKITVLTSNIEEEDMGFDD